MKPIYKEYQQKYTEHLKNEKKKQEKDFSTSKQLSRMEAQDRGHKWDINDARAQQVHKFMMENDSTRQSAFLACGRYRFCMIIAGAWAQVQSPK